MDRELPAAYPLPMRVQAMAMMMLLFFSGCFRDPGTGMSDDRTDESTEGSTDEGTDEGEGDGETPDLPAEMTDVPDDPEATPPALRYDFDGQVDDQAGMADGEEVGLFVYAEGVEGLAATFTGEQYVDASTYAGELRAHLDSFSISIRLRPHAYSSIQMLLLLGEQGESVETNQFAIQTRDGQVELVTETGLGADHLVTLGPVPSPQSWHSLVFTFHGGSARYYMDGEVIGETSYVPPETTAAQLTMMGSSWEAKGWNGLVDDVAVFAGALDDDEALWLSCVSQEGDSGCAN